MNHQPWLLLRSVQRYKFESNSQPFRSACTSHASCCDQYKDTNLKAIHNRRAVCASAEMVVAISTKIQIWKQFTTRHWPHHDDWGLLRSVQRYKFESNSQRWKYRWWNYLCCCDQYKDTNLKAIHNWISTPVVSARVVAISTKIQIWKQFTTCWCFVPSEFALLRSVQRYKFESNSQRHRGAPVHHVRCCDQYKDTNLKAIHNSITSCSRFSQVVAISTKIQIWKQFTTWISTE